MFRKKWFWIVLGALVLAGAAFAAYMIWFRPKNAEVTEPTLQTATVTVGDISLTAAGSGMLVAAAEANLAFSTSGTLLGLAVTVGDVVEEGAVLAWIDDSDARQAVASAELAVMQADQALELAQAQAELTLAEAQVSLDTAQNELDSLLAWEPDATELEAAKAALTSAQAAYQSTLAKSSVDQTISARISLESAVANLASAQEAYVSAMDPGRDWERDIATTRDNAANSVYKAQQSLQVAQANYDLAMINTTSADISSAKAKVTSAQEALDELETPPDEAEIASARIKVQQASITLTQAQFAIRTTDSGSNAATREAEIALEQAQIKLAAARDDLDGTTLKAPFAGTITAVNANVGDAVSGTVIALANLTTPVVQFWVEESELSSIAVGHPVRITIDALPDLSFSGEIYQVDPVLVSVSGTSAVQAWATIDASAYSGTLLGDMNVELEVIAGEALGAMVVPVQALRELGDGKYATFVVKDDGTLEMRMLEIGLMDYVNAQVLSGLEMGETVSLGEEVESTSSVSTEDAFEQGPMFMEFSGGPGPDQGGFVVGP